MSKYDSIINLPYYELKYHKRMSIDNRAAQFSAYDALTGYKEIVKETARLTKSKKELSEDNKNDIDSKLHIIKKYINEKPKITVVYFKKDIRKTGGNYLEYTNIVKIIDDIEKVIIFMDKTKIKIENIIDIKGEIFEEYM